MADSGITLIDVLIFFGKTSPFWITNILVYYLFMRLGDGWEEKKLLWSKQDAEFLSKFTQAKFYGCLALLVGTVISFGYIVSII